MQCTDHTRRSRLLTALAADACLASKFAGSKDDGERPQIGDLLVVSEGEHQGSVFKPDDLKLGGPPVRAWPRDSNTSVVSNGSRLAIRLDCGELDEETRRRCAEGIVARSEVCSYVGCSATGCWLTAEQSDKDIHTGFCYNFEFSPRESAQVAFGPALRRLAAPLTIADGSLTVTATFVGKVGAQQPR